MRLGYCVIAIAAAAGGQAADTAYPVRPVRLLVPQAAGGSNDIMARNVANFLTVNLGRQVVVDNRPGAEGIIGTALFKSLSGLDFTILLYKGGFPAMIDVMGGQAHMTVGSIVQSIPHIRSGKLKPIATGSATRAGTLPDLPTIAESGVPGYDAANWWAIAAPAGTPQAVIAKLNAAVATYLGMPETQKRFLNEGAEVDIRTPAAVVAMIPLDMAKWARVAKDAGMRAD